MTELSFLVDLIVNHKLPKLTKERILERIKEVEAAFVHRPMPSAPSIHPFPGPMPVPAHLANQAPSTVAAMIRHQTVQEPSVEPTQQPVTQIAQTVAAANALAARQAAIDEAVLGKPPKGQTRPRKF